MLWTILGVGIIAVGVVIIVEVVKEQESFLYLIIGAFIAILGIAIILFCIPSDRYTEWTQTNEGGMIEQVNGKYVEDDGIECRWRLSTYTETGEKADKDKSISIIRRENVFVTFVEIDEDETAAYAVFTRESISILGVPNGFTHTRYVFYIPKQD